ncbi:MAG: FAD-dependent oxidoreductase [Gammaproteobacteria bacterium]
MARTAIDRCSSWRRRSCVSWSRLSATSRVCKIRARGHLHALNYTLGLARAAQSLGVTIHERTRARRFGRDTGLGSGFSTRSLRSEIGSPPILRVETTGGSVRCRYLVLAGNVYMGELARELRSKILGIGTCIVADGRKPQSGLQFLVEAVGHNLAELIEALQPRAQVRIAHHHGVVLRQRLQVRILDGHDDGACSIARIGRPPHAYLPRGTLGLAQRTALLERLHVSRNVRRFHDYHAQRGRVRAADEQQRRDEPYQLDLEIHEDLPCCSCNDRNQRARVRLRSAGMQPGNTMTRDGRG